MTELKLLVHRLIDKFGTNLLNKPTLDQITLVQHAIMQQNFLCSDQLLDYASQKRMAVSCCWGDTDDILKWAIAQRCTESVSYILKKLSEKCSTTEETGRVLRRSFLNLIDYFSRLTKDFLCGDRFIWELGRFQVPVKMLDKVSSLVVETCDRCPDGEHKSSVEAKAFWSNMNPKMKRCISEASDVQVMAVAKYVCVDDLAQVGKQGMLRHLLFRSLSVEFFKSEIVRCVAKWKWRTFWRQRFLLLVFLHAVLLLSFSAIAAWPSENKIWNRSCFKNETNSETEGKNSTLDPTNQIELVEGQNAQNQTGDGVCDFGDLFSTDFIALAVSYFLCLWFIVIECLQLSRHVKECRIGLRHYFNSPWNLIKLLSYAIMLIFFTPYFSQRFIGKDTAETAVALECMLLWITVSS